MEKDFFTRKVDKTTIHKKLFKNSLINDSLTQRLKESFKNVSEITVRKANVLQGFSYIEIKTK